MPSYIHGRNESMLLCGNLIDRKIVKNLEEIGFVSITLNDHFHTIPRQSKTIGIFVL